MSSLGLQRQGHGDHGSLPHAAGQLVRVLLDAPLRGRHAHEAEGVDCPVPGFLLLDVVVQLDRLGDLVADREDRVEASHRLLEDHRDLAAANSLILSVDSLRRSRPSNQTSPPAISPGGMSIRRMIV